MTRGSRAKAQRRQAAPEERPHRARPGWLRPAVIVVALAVVGGGTTAFALLSGGDGDGDSDSDRDGVSAAEVAPPTVPPAAGYRVVYRVDDTAGAEPFTATDVVEVRQPFESRLEHREGPPPGGEVSSATVVNQRFQFNSSRGEERFATGRIPGPLPQTYSREVLDAAVDGGVAERPGTRTVGSEECAEYAYRRAGEALAKADSAEKVLACVAGDGVLLREEIILGGRTVRVAEAVEVDRNPTFTEETFLSRRDPSAEPEARFLETEQVVSEGESDASRVKASVPEGFTVARQVTVNRQLGPGAPPANLFVRGFTRDRELVVTEELISASPRAPWTEDEGQPLELGGGRTARVVHRPGYTEVRVTARGRFVKVISPRPAVALAVARTVEA